MLSLRRSSSFYRLRMIADGSDVSTLSRHTRYIGSRLQQMSLEFSSKLWWRFMKYKELLNSMFGMHHPCISDEDQLGLAMTVLGRDCCVPRYSAQKMAMHWPSPEALKSDKCLKGSLTAASATLRLTDMRSERMPARCTTSVDGRAVEVEKVSARACLDICLSDHVQRLGRNYPRFCYSGGSSCGGRPHRCTSGS